MLFTKFPTLKLSSFCQQVSDGHLLFHIPLSFYVAATAPPPCRFQVFRFVVTRSQFSTIAKNHSMAALTASRSLSLAEPYLLCTNNLKPTTSERLIKNDDELERRIAQHHQMAEILFSPLKLKSFQKRFFDFQKGQFI